MQPVPTMPLAGLKVLAFEQYGAGPFGTQFLADLGAEVIKVGIPADGGDMARTVGPHFLEAEGASDASLFFQAFNRNKRSITLDLSQAGVAPGAGEAGGALRRAGEQSARRRAGEARPDLRQAGACQSQNRLRLPVGLWPRRQPRRMAGLRLPDAGRGRLFLADRRGRHAAVAHGSFHRRPDDRPRPGLRAGQRGAQGARDRARDRHRHLAVRPRLLQPLLSVGLVSQHRPCPGPRAALGPSVADAVPALSHRRRLDLPDVQQGEILADPVQGASAGRNGPPTRASPASRRGWRIAR